MLLRITMIISLMAQAALALLAVDACFEAFSTSGPVEIDPYADARDGMFFVAACYDLLAACILFPITFWLCTKPRTRGWKSYAVVVTVLPYVALPATCLFLASLVGRNYPEVLLNLPFFVVIVPLILAAFAIWRQPHIQKTERKKIFLKLSLVMTAPIIFLGVMLGSAAKDLYDEASDAWAINHASLVHYQETIIPLNKLPVGVHIDAQIDMPAIWADRHSRCNGFRVRFSDGDYSSYDLDMRNPRDSCALSADKRIYSMKLAADYYPFSDFTNGWQTPSRACGFFAQGASPETPVTSAQSLTFEQLVSFDLEGVSLLGHGDNISLLQRDIDGKTHFLLDGSFWKNAIANFTPANLLADGYKMCMGFENAPRGIMDPTACYCLGEKAP